MFKQMRQQWQVNRALKWNALQRARNVRFAITYLTRPNKMQAFRNIQSALAICLSLVTVNASIGNDEAPAAITIGEKHQIQSKVLEEPRTLLVHLPEQYAEKGNARFPVIYVLDGESHFTYALGIVERLARSASAIPPHIVVGIPNQGRSRIRDFRLAGPKGADDFVRFLATDAIPFVDKSYRTHPARTLVGHSSAGLFAIYAMAHAPELFTSYIVSSPWLPGNEDVIADELTSLFDQSAEDSEFLYLSVGEHESELTNPFRTLTDQLRAKAGDRVDWHAKTLSGEGHMTTPAPTLHNALLTRYEGYNLDFDAQPVVDGHNAVKAYYRDFSNRLGYEVQIPDGVIWNLVSHRMLAGEFTQAKKILDLGEKSLPEPMLHNNGYYALREDQPDKAVAIFRQYVRDYPERPNAYDSLGDALEASGQLDEALAAVKKACELASEQDDSQLAVYQGHRAMLQEAIRQNR